MLLLFYNNASNLKTLKINNEKIEMTLFILLHATSTWDIVTYSVHIWNGAFKSKNFQL